MSQYIGALTSGGDCPRLYPALCGVGKAGIDSVDMEIRELGRPGQWAYRDQSRDRRISKHVLQLFHVSQLA